MSYSISLKLVDGQTGLYARVKKRQTETWWDQSSSAWVATESSDCNITLSGSGNTYTGTAGLTAVAGMIYAIYVYDSSDALVAVFEAPLLAANDTALHIVNQIQKKLRLPQTATAAWSNDLHAQLMLDFANQIYVDVMTENYAWEELKLRGQIVLKDGIALYTLFPFGAANIDVIRTLQIGTSDPIVILNDQEWQSYTTTTGGSESQPLYARIYHRAGGAITLEFAPTPDASYPLDFEILQIPSEMSASTDIPLLDANTIVAGAVLLARAEQGEDMTIEIESFKSKASLSAGARSESNLGDLEIC